MREPKERLLDTLQAIANIERCLERGRDAFEKDELLQTWLLRQLQIIGEAVRALPNDVRTLAPDVPWSKIVGMCNVLVHGYFDIDEEIVWEVTARDVPALKPHIERLLRILEGVE